MDQQPEMTSQDEPRHLRPHEVAARWNISPRTLERWRAKGTGPRFLRLGRLVVYRVEDIKAFEADHLHGA